MANGDYLSIKEFQKLAKPINSIKDDLDAFANKRNIDTTYHHHGWVMVELKWKNNNGLDCMLSLTLKNNKSTYSLGLCSYKYMNDIRYFKGHALLDDISTPFNVAELFRELEKGYDICNDIDFNELQKLAR